jgi:nucleotide-binding universal stress UspA family protein
MKYVNWILVPIDFSDESRLALEYADRQANMWNAGLILLHVKKPITAPRPHLTIEESGLERWGRWITQTPPDQVTYLTCVGEPAEEILRIAEQYRPRKIVMGRGGDAVHSGTVTREVARGFPGLLEAISRSHDDVFVHARVCLGGAS